MAAPIRIMPRGMSKGRDMATEYDITILSLAAPAPVKTSGTPGDKNTPFTGSGSGSLNLNGATVSTLTVSDDDSNLDGIHGARSYGGGLDSNQVVSTTTTISYGVNQSSTLQAGSVIGYDFSGKIYCMEDGVVTAVYEVAFLRTPTTSGVGAVVGGNHLVMVIPVEEIVNGVTLAAQPFDITQTYKYGGNYDYGTSNYQIAYYDVDCFATGTLIDTPAGPRPVQALQAGDLVLTADEGPQAVIWAGHVDVDAHWLDLQPNLRPIRIAAGALSPGYPARDLVLSPQHRVLVRSAIAERMFAAREVLVAVKHLVGLPGIEVMKPAAGIGYHHLLLARHQVLRAEGAAVESLYLGPQALKNLPPAERREIMALFPELAARGDHAPEPARRLVSGREGRKLAERHGRNRKPLVDGATALHRKPLPA